MFPASRTQKSVVDGIPTERCSSTTADESLNENPYPQAKVEQKLLTRYSSAASESRKCFYS